LNISIHIIQTQEITELVKDIYTPYFTLFITLHPPTPLFLSLSIEIVSKILNPRKAKIKGWREYVRAIEIPS
jgi:hypothetical protein